MVVVGVQHVESPSRRSFLLLRIDRFSGFAARRANRSGVFVLALEHAYALSRFAGRLRRSLSLSGPALLLRHRAGGWGRVSSLLWEPGRL